MPPVIAAKELYKAYPGFPPVLRGVNIDVQPGEMAAIMGPSGCGKSTMLHLLGMLHKPDAGTLRILDQDVLAFNSEQTAAFRRGNMGFVMQASNLFDHSTVFENVEFPLIYENVPPQERWERVIRALDLVRLSARVHYRSNRLSGGEQQRVAIARAMVNNPRILLADEPTGALDARTSRVIMENFRSLCHDGGVAMVMVTHDPKMAEYCDSIYTLDDGLLNCHKHVPPKIAAPAHRSFLDQPDPVVRGALVAWRFPTPQNRSILQLAARMHKEQLLARIYALTRNSPFASEAGYSLPLAVRHMGFWGRLSARPVHASGELRKAAHAVARGAAGFFASRMALGAGCIINAWLDADNAGFLYAAGARKVGAATAVAATLGGIPYAFAVQPQDFPRLDRACGARAQKAAFVTCSTKALRDAFLKRYAEIPPEKVLLLPNPPFFATEEETEAATVPSRAVKPADLLCMGGAGLDAVLRALRHLRTQGIAFRLTVLGKRGHVWLARWLGIGKFVNFATREDRLAEDFRLADIFIALADKRPGYELGMPWQLCEAMCFALPVVSLGITEGMAPLADGRNGIVCADAAALAQALKILIDDKKKAAALGLQAKKDMRASLDFAEADRMLADRMAMAAGSHAREADQ